MPKKAVSMKLDEELLKAAKAQQDRHDRTFTWMVEEGLKLITAKLKKKKP